MRIRRHETQPIEILPRFKDLSAGDLYTSEGAPQTVMMKVKSTARGEYYGVEVESGKLWTGSPGANVACPADPEQCVQRVNATLVEDGVAAPAASRTTKQDLLVEMKRLNACFKAVAWVTQTAVPQDSAQEIWDACPRGDWLLWMLGRQHTLAGAVVGDDRHKQIVLAACACAREALPYAKSDTILRCIETTESWARGTASLNEVRTARKAAYYAANAAAAADAYYHYYGEEARKKMQAKCANAVRTYFPKVPA